MWGGRVIHWPDTPTLKKFLLSASRPILTFTFRPSAATLVTLTSLFKGSQAHDLHVLNFRHCDFGFVSLVPTVLYYPIEGKSEIFLSFTCGNLVKTYATS